MCDVPAELPWAIALDCCRRLAAHGENVLNLWFDLLLRDCHCQYAIAKHPLTLIFMAQT